MDTTAKPFRDPHRKPAIACGLFVVVTVAMIAIAGQNKPTAIDLDAVAEALEVAFVDQPDGSVVASDAATGAELERIAPGGGGFIRVTMRSFAAERKARGLGPEVPFTLSRMTDGDLILQDRLTGRTMLLNAFGPSNEGVFAQLLDDRRTSQ